MLRFLCLRFEDRASLRLLKIIWNSDYIGEGDFEFLVSLLESQVHAGSSGCISYLNKIHPLST